MVFMSVIAVTTHVSFFEVLTHEQVERATGVDACACDGRAAVAQQSQTEVGALLRLLLEQQLRKLKTKKKQFQAIQCTILISYHKVQPS